MGAGWHTVLSPFLRPWRLRLRRTDHQQCQSPGLQSVDTGGKEKDLVEDFGADDRPRVLIVDDNVWDARLLRRLVEARKRFEAVEAHTVSQAMEIIDFKVPDLIMLDLMIPGSSGEEMLGVLRSREDTKHVPVIVVTGKDLSQRERTFFSDHKVNSVWNKGSLDRSSLLALVEELLVE